MQKSIMILMLFMSIGTWAQTATRTNLHGRVVNDSTKIENVIVFNTNARKGAIIKDGFFDIDAKVKDTLVFSSMTFKIKKIVLQENDFSGELVVRLTTFINLLNEVKINNKKYSPVQENTQTYVDRQYIDDEQSHLKNANVYDGQTPGINFVRLFKDVVKLFKKKNPKKIDYFADVSFTELVLNKIKYNYFINTLKLKDEEVRLFLVFCENDNQAQNLSRYKTSFELMDFLYNKNKEFTIIKNEIK